MANRKYEVVNCPICGGEVRIQPDSRGVILPWTLTEPKDPETIIDVTIVLCEPSRHEVKIYRIRSYLPYA
ncbi:MAG: hypothetical protein OK404_00115 [Thaumarchaeota archaeon]|nr:hypothetical protein [Nitrososphaerota archaeon]